MRRLPRVVILFGILMICGVISYLVAPNASDTPPRVHFEMDAPKRAFLRETTEIEVRVQNVGTIPVRDLGVKINRGYASAFTVIGTQPRSQIDDASTEKRLYFGPLAGGESKTYRISLSPQRLGDFGLTVRFVAARRGFDPLPLVDPTAGIAELTATTSVVARP